MQVDVSTWPVECLMWGWQYGQKKHNRKVKNVYDKLRKIPPRSPKSFISRGDTLIGISAAFDGGIACDGHGEHGEASPRLEEILGRLESWEGNTGTPCESLISESPIQDLVLMSESKFFDVTVIRSDCLRDFEGCLLSWLLSTGKWHVRSLQRESHARCRCSSHRTWCTVLRRTGSKFGILFGCLPMKGPVWMEI